jgi:hypothetical protein
MRPAFPLVAVVAFAIAACGPGVAPARSASARQVLMSGPELLEFESASTRQELYREVAGISVSEAGGAEQRVLFPIIQNGALIAAPGFDARADLLQVEDVGAQLQLVFDGRAGERWPEDRRDALQGLSEREAAELVGRSLLARWGIVPGGRVQVDRAAMAPYAAAYVDGILRINPSFLYLAAAAGLPSAPGSVQ